MRRASSCAAAAESFTPARSTYSKVTRRFVRATYRALAARTSSIPHFRLIGMIAPRVSSSAACSEIARLIGNPSPARSSIFGTTPQVEIVSRRGLIPNRSAAISSRTDAIVAS
jgi:hypothetical protein